MTWPPRDLDCKRHPEFSAQARSASPPGCLRVPGEVPSRQVRLAGWPPRLGTVCGQCAWLGCGDAGSRLSLLCCEVNLRGRRLHGLGEEAESVGSPSLSPSVTALWAPGARPLPPHAGCPGYLAGADGRFPTLSMLLLLSRRPRQNQVQSCGNSESTSEAKPRVSVQAPRGPRSLLMEAASLRPLLISWCPRQWPPSSCCWLPCLHPPWPCFPT